jgi:hypothetical protein
VFDIQFRLPILRNFLFQAVYQLKQLIDFGQVRANANTEIANKMRYCPKNANIAVAIDGMAIVSLPC